MREAPYFDPPEIVPRPVEYENPEAFLEDLQGWEAARKGLREAQSSSAHLGAYAIDALEGKYEEYFRRLESFFESVDDERNWNVEQVIDSMTSDQRVALFGAMGHSLWLDWQTHGDRELHDLTAYESSYARYEHLMIYGMKVAAEQSDKVALKEFWSGLLDVDEGDRGFGMLLDESLFDEARLVGVVEYINTFGFIPTVDRLATAITQSENPSSLKQLYERLQGQEVEAVRALLTEVYARVDYKSCALAEKEITQEEGDRIEAIVIGSEELTHQERAAKHLLDLACGPGRNALEMIKRGYQVTAMDYEGNHIAELLDELELLVASGELSADAHERLMAEVGTWFDLSKYTFEKSGERVDMVYCVGRSLAHARTMKEMLDVWGQIRQVLAEGGDFVFDMPELNGDKKMLYDEKVTNMRQNLQSLGVENVDENFVFDGPSATERFNRQVLGEGQIRDLAYLMGFYVESAESVEMDNGHFRDTYYHLRVDQLFDPTSLDRRQVGEALTRLGLMKVSEDVNLNAMIEPWGVTLGQVWFWLDGGDGVREWQYRNEIRRAEGYDPEDVVAWNLGGGLVGMRTSL